MRRHARTALGRRGGAGPSAARGVPREHRATAQILFRAGDAAGDRRGRLGGRGLRAGQRGPGGPSRRGLVGRGEPRSTAVIILKSAEEIALMRRAGRTVARMILDLLDAYRPGMSTADLDEVAERRCVAEGCVPSFK